MWYNQMKSKKIADWTRSPIIFEIVYERSNYRDTQCVIAIDCMAKVIAFTAENLQKVQVSSTSALFFTFQVFRLMNER